MFVVDLLVSRKKVDAVDGKKFPEKMEEEEMKMMMEMPKWAEMTSARITTLEVIFFFVFVVFKLMFCHFVFALSMSKKFECRSVAHQQHPAAGQQREIR